MNRISIRTVGFALAFLQSLHNIQHHNTTFRGHIHLGAYLFKQKQVLTDLIFEFKLLINKKLTAF